MDTSMPRMIERLGLWAWCFTTFLAVVCLLLYLPMSTRPELEALSESPHVLTLAFVAATLSTIALGAWLARGPTASRHLRSILRTGTVAAVIGCTSYTSYVYAFSQTLPDSDAPAVGEMAIDFEIKDPDGRYWKLSDFRGSTVLLVFYRGNW
jgi:hypothetical protein